MAKKSRFSRDKEKDNVSDDNQNNSQAVESGADDEKKPGFIATAAKKGAGYSALGVLGAQGSSSLNAALGAYGETEIGMWDAVKLDFDENIKAVTDLYRSAVAIWDTASANGDLTTIEGAKNVINKMESGLKAMKQAVPGLIPEHQGFESLSPGDQTLLRMVVWQHLLSGPFAGVRSSLVTSGVCKSDYDAAAVISSIMQTPGSMKEWAIVTRGEG